MPFPDRWHATRSDLWVLALFFLLVLGTFRGILIGANDPFSSSLRTYHPWRGNLTEADAARPESFVKDPTTQSYPWADYAHEHLQRGDFPLWNTRIFSGTPFTANRLTGLFNPLALMAFWLFPPAAGLSILYFVHYLLAAWFVYLFLKSLGISRPAAVFGAIAYLFQGVYIPWGGTCALDRAYLPMSFYYLERTCDRRDRAGILGCVVSFALLAVVSYPQTAVFAVYAAFFWVLFTQGRGLRPASRRVLGLIAILFLAFLLGAMQHLPTVEFYSLSLRAEPEFQVGLATRSRVERYDSPISLVAIFFPKLWGDYLANPASTLPEYVLQVYNHAYIGILAAFGALLAPLVWRNRYARFFTAASILGCMFIAWHKFYLLFVQALPGLRISRVKPHFLIFSSIIIVSVFVLDHLFRNLRTDPVLARRLDRGYGWLLGVMLGATVAIVVARAVPGLIPAADAVSYLHVQLGLFILTLAGTLVYLHVKRHLAFRWLVAGIILLELIDLVPYHDHFTPLVARGRTCFRTESIEFLEEKTVAEGPFRVFRDRNAVLPPNTPMLFRLDEIGGFDSFISADYAHFFRRIDPQMSRNPRTLDMPAESEHYQQPFWSFLGVRYLLSAGRMPDLLSPWRLAASSDRDLYIYENVNWLPRWFLVPRIIPVETLEEGWDAALAIDPRHEAVVVGIEYADIPPALLGDPFEGPIGTLRCDFYGADVLRLTANCQRDSFLVFSDTYFPGWRAWVDGEELPVYRTDGIIKGIVVPAGAHSVRFVYDPPLYKWGWLLALIGAILTPFFIRPIRWFFTS